MIKIFTKLVWVLAGVAVYFPAIGQDRLELRTESVSSLSKKVELRTEEARPQRDSIIQYSATGENTRKYDDALGICYEWKNNSWVSNDGYSPCQGIEYGFYVGGIKYEIDGNQHFFYYPMSYYSTYYFRDDLTDIGSNASNFKFETVYNSNQQLTKLTMTFFRNDFTNEWVREISYNAQGNPLTIDYNRNGTLVQKVNYSYLPDGIHCYLFEEWNLHVADETSETVFDDSGNVLSVSWWSENSNRYRYDFKYNDYFQENRVDFYTGSGDKWLLDWYNISYYSEETTGNEQIESPITIAYLTDQTLYIHSEIAELIEIYSISGIKLYEYEIQTGVNTINTSNLPQGILFVKGRSGWVTKVVNKN